MKKAFLFSIAFLITSLTGLELYKYGNPSKYKHVRFSGGGVYFWWQAGCCKYLQENQIIKFDSLPIIGTSSGALAATLLVTGSNFDHAADFVIEQAYRYKLFEKPTGLAGVWGPIVREWLEEILPKDIPLKSTENLFIAATPVSLCRGPELLQGFESREDLIDACMASVHIPLFMDGKLTATYREEPYVDGSFWSYAARRVFDEPVPPAMHAQGLLSTDIPMDEVLVVDYTRDLIFRNQVKGSFVTLLSPDGVRSMMDSGYQYMKSFHELNYDSF
mmetsp:Transcript_6044/g.6183  ORF Transcript_6044/g.6183 Transcript_6044/m.6183 type:complete len:275 (-) Transcript_6044:380-1204(-)